MESIPKPPSLEWVEYKSDEVTSTCPVTGQPDYYTITIGLEPLHLIIESKSLKLYLQGFRNRGIFCEALADRIAKDLFNHFRPQSIKVRVDQKSRGGITISASSHLCQTRQTDDEGS